MGRLIFITQAYLPESTILGVTRDWVHALARYWDGVDVIALSGTPEQDISSKVRVYSLGKERGAGKTRQLASLYAALTRTLGGASAVFVHMVPRYVLLSLPFTLTTKKPVGLWYAQGGISRALRLASRTVQHIFTPTRDSFPLTGSGVERRLRITGHGIDATRYAPAQDIAVVPGRMLAVGRLARAKRYHALVAALPFLRSPEWHVRILSGSLYATQDQYEQQLRAQIKGLNDPAGVTLAGSVPYPQMAAEYRAATVLAHTSATGSLDKVVLESMACGTPVVSTAPSSRSLLAPIEPFLAVAMDTPEMLAAALDEVLSWPASRRKHIGEALRAHVTSHHSLDGWAERVSDHLHGFGSS